MENTLGLFPERTTRTREPKAPPEPVVLNPYQPRPTIPYELMTDAEIAAGAGQVLIFDIESYVNFFLVAFRSVTTGKVILFTDDLDVEKLEWIVRNYILVGFNSLSYDMPLLWVAIRGATTEALKKRSNELVSAQNRVNVPRTHHIDLIEVCPGHGGLKLYMARLHAPRIQDLPFDHNTALEEWQKPLVVDYCINNDLVGTQMLYEGLREQLELRRSLSMEYGKNFLSKSDAQIAEAVISLEMHRLVGSTPERPKVTDAVYRFKAPANLKFKSKYMRDVLAVIESAEFRLDAGGRLERPQEIENLEVQLGNSVYRMGVGGLHSSEKCMALVADDAHEIIDRDVASYYPAIIINCNLVPQALGKDFLTVYKGLVERRLAAKKFGDIAVSENLKVAINGAFGKTGSPHSILYSPDVFIQILLGGQLYLLMLIELVEATGVSVMSANTDGFVMRCPKHLRPRVDAVVAAWERSTGFVTEAASYRGLWARDVNAYIAVTTDGKVKSKNIFYDPWRGKGAREQYWRFQKNPTCQICAEAVERFVVDGAEVAQTIYECNDVRKFLAIKSVTGGAHKNADYLGRIVRWYYAVGETGHINYISNGRIVADTLGARPLMDLPAKLPDDIDYAWYVRRAEAMLVDCGWVK